MEPYKNEQFLEAYKDEQFFTQGQFLISIHPDIWEDADRTQDLWSYAIYDHQEFIDSDDGCDAVLEGFSFVSFEWCKEVAFKDLQEYEARLIEEQAEVDRANEGEE